MTQAPPQAPAGPVVNPGKGLSIAGMVLGIVSLAVLCIPYVNFLSLVCAIVGLILSIIGKKKSKAANAPTGMATAGIVLSIIALAIAIVVVLIVGLLFSILFATVKEIQHTFPNGPAGAIESLKLLF